jgi:hypothetical protein
MNHAYFPMRYLATVALLLFGSMSVAPAIPPGFISKNGTFVNRTSFSGKVSHVDQNARTFTVHSKRTIRNHNAREVGGGGGRSVEITFNTTVKTTYVSGSWTNLKNGIHVKVAYHLEGPNSDTVVADSVQIISGF